MNVSQSILGKPRVVTFFSWCLAGFLRFIFFTSRKVVHVDNAALAYMQGDANAIFSFWHGYMSILPAFCPPKRKMRVLISVHRDGTLISQIIGRFGQETVNGSSRKGGKEAFTHILRALEAGDNISITPDGPRGPQQIAAPGVVAIAKLSGKPILPVTFSSTFHIRFKSWDHFMLALPFGRIAFYVGCPIMVPADADDDVEEAARQRVENEMNALVNKALKETHG